MESLNQFLPLLIIGVVIYFIIRGQKRKNEKFRELERKVEQLHSENQEKNSEDLRDEPNVNILQKELNQEELWKKSRVGLYIVIPFIAIFDIVQNDSTGSNQNLIPTIVNFFITREIVKRVIKTDRDIKFPKLFSVAVSLGVFFIQVVIGFLLTDYPK